MVRVLGPRYSLRCVVFHHIADTESPFTLGLNVTISPGSFEAALRFVTKHYAPVRLSDVLADPEGRSLPARPVLLTFDDAYASVAEIAAPLCRKYGVPALFFVNAACLNAREWALDNLICYVVNVFGLAAVNDLSSALMAPRRVEIHSMAEIFAKLLPEMPVELRQTFHKALLELLPRGDRNAVAEAGLYLTSQQLRTLTCSDFEIGNHTYTHVHCRRLSRSNFQDEIDQNKIELETICERPVRAFSVPYGSTADLTDDVASHLYRTGHEAVFLSESVANPGSRNLCQFDRVSTRATTDADLFAEIEVLPRIRAMRNRLLRRRKQNPPEYPN